MQSPATAVPIRPRRQVPVRVHDGALLASGDPVAREQFFEDIYGRMIAYVTQRVNDPHLAEDLTHEILLKVDASLARLDPKRDPSGWVFTIASNVIRDHWRRRDTRVARTSVDIGALHDPPADRAARIDDSLVAAEQHDQLHRALDGLSRNDRQVLRLRAFGRLSNDEVARTLRLRPDAVRKRWSRAVRRLGDAYRAIDAESRRASDRRDDLERRTKTEGRRARPSVFGVAEPFRRLD